MQSYYPERFERDMGTSETEWLTALPRALGEQAFELGTGQARVQIAADETETSLAGKVLQLEHRLYPAVLRAVCAGDAQPIFL